MAFAIILPNARNQFIGADGSPIVGGTVTFYIPNTSTPKNTWQDSTQSVLNTNPVVLDSLGSAQIYGNGQYRQVLKDAAGNTLWDKLTSSSPLAGNFISLDGSNNFTVNEGPDLFADTTGRLVWGLNAKAPAGPTYVMTDDDRGSAISAYNAASGLTVTLPDPLVVGDNFVTFFHRGDHAMTIQSGSANIFTPQYQLGTNSITLPTVESFIGFFSNLGNWTVWTGSPTAIGTEGSSLVYSESNQTIPHNANVARTWTTVLHDVHGFWNVSNPTRLTVPAGVAKIVLTGNTRFITTSSSEGYKFFLFKNGATFTGCPFLETSTNGVAVYPSGGVTSGEILVTPGDYFEFMVRQSSGGDVTTSADIAGVNWFSAQITQWIS